MTRRELLIGGIGSAISLCGCNSPHPINNLASSFRRKYPALFQYIQSMQYIPTGTYTYGAPEKPSLGINATSAFRIGPVNCHFDNSQSILGQRLDVSPFWLGQTPVTWAVWKEYRGPDNFMDNTPSWGMPDNHPVVSISSYDIYDSPDKVVHEGGFLAWATKVSGIRFSIPTVVEFEYAARGGKDGFYYPWGNDGENESFYWASRGPKKRKMTAPVNRQHNIYTNGYNLTDMCGNVRQFCHNLTGSGSEIIVKGGGWKDEGGAIRNDVTKTMQLWESDLNTGLRLRAYI
jgi:formylglycine-generating enzyme required for sulfatase activity